MVVDYCIDLSCEPKRQFGRGGLLQRLQSLDNYHTSPEVGSQAAQATTLALEAGFELRPMAFHCKGCPANATRKPFGCFGTVIFPISAEAEEWLINLLPTTLDRQEAGSPRLEAQIDWTRKLIDLLPDVEVKDRVLRDRRHVDTWFQRTRTAHRTYGSLFRRVRISMDHLAHVLFFQERVEARMAEAVCRALGVWVDGNAGPDGVREVIFTQPPERNEDPSITELKLFLHAMMVGCSVDVGVRTELVETL